MYRQTGSKEDSLDLTQEIFIAVLHSIHTYNPQKAAFRTWLYRIATNKIIDSKRRIRPEIISIDDTEPSDTEDFAVTIENKFVLDQIESYISRLDPELQAIFRLHLYAEKTFSEIAIILEQSETAVKARYYRLMSRLRKEFSKYDSK